MAEVINSQLSNEKQKVKVFGNGKMALFASMLAKANNAAENGILSFSERREIETEVRNIKQGFTSSPDAKKRRSRRRYQLAFESRRRNCC